MVASNGISDSNIMATLPNKTVTPDDVKSTVAT